MPVDATMIILTGLGGLSAALAGALPVGRRTLPRPDDGPLGVGAGVTALCPACAVQLQPVPSSREPDGTTLLRVRCSDCRTTYAVRSAIVGVPEQRQPAD
jgi:hypothetical protein